MLVLFVYLGFGVGGRSYSNFLASAVALLWYVRSPRSYDMVTPRRPLFIPYSYSRALNKYQHYGPVCLLHSYGIR